jgi:3-methyladenine DNA glycosylase AlkD
MTIARKVLADLRSMRSEKNRTGMARFGINVDNALGVSVTDLRKLARKIKPRDHRLAADLWASGVHEARILASMVDEPERVTQAQADRWVRDFDSWDLCDQVCMNLFDKLPFAHDKAIEWAGRKKEFQKRAGFAMMACLASHDRKATDARFKAFLPIIEHEASDDRNFVKKAVNWALRGIGKRNRKLNAAAIRCANQIAKQDSRSARWIASDALRELQSPAVAARLG